MKPETKQFTVLFEPAEDGWWTISVREVKGELVENVKLPTAVKDIVVAALAERKKARALAKVAQRSQEVAACALDALGVSRRNAAKILGISHQRVQQITK